MGNHVSVQSPEAMRRELYCDTFDAISSMRCRVGHVVTLRGHTVAGLGGGRFVANVGSVVSDGWSKANTATPGVYLERERESVYSIEMAGGRADGVTDNKLPHERISAVSNIVFLEDTGTYHFSAAPTLTSKVTTVLSSDAAVSGVTLDQLRARVFDAGQLCGVPFASLLRDKKVNFFCGVIRQHTPQDVVGITRSGSTATVHHIAHGYSTGMYVVMNNVNETDYYGYHQITVIDADHYSYVVANSPATPATIKSPALAITSRNPAWWFFINDADHVPVGVSDSLIYNPITGTSTTLTFGLSETYERVLVTLVGADETLAAAQGLSIGSSTALGGVAFRMSCDRTLAYEFYYDSGTGLWSAASSSGQDLLDELTFSSGNLRVKHKYCPKVNIGLTAYSRNGTVVPYVPVLKNVQNGEFTVNFLDYAAGGLVVTAADNKMSLYATKNFCNIVPFDGSSGSWSIPFYLGNIWFMGFMERS